ncbi:VCBS repeat-containing protein [Streptomyces sp. NPDC047072]|uniref:FG-GAP repeat domain-containing protein n=1 Tax=Streptomyces sp. NPDC047072 TaxID=3154809 RepID=UPI0033C16E77
MARHAFVRLRIAAASAVLAAGLSPLLPSTAAVAETAQETVVPATLRSSNLTGSLVGYNSADYGTEGAGAQGFFHRIEGRSGIVWTRYADGETVAAPASAGAYLVFGTGSDVLDYRYNDGRSVLFDAVSGTTRTVRMTEGRTLFRFYGSTAVTYRGVPNEDGTTSARDFRLSTVGDDGAMVDTEIGGVPEGMTLGTSRGADATGVFFLARLDGTLRMVEVDRETARVRGWTQPLPSGYTSVRFSRDHVALYGKVSDAKVLVVPRSDLSATPAEVTLGDGTGVGPASNVALVGDWLVHRPSDGTAVKAVPIKGGASVTLLTSSNLGVSAAPDDTALYLGRTAADDWGFQRLVPGADGGPPVVTQAKALPKPPYRIQGLALHQGRLLVADESRSGYRDTYLRTVAATGTPTYGARSNYDGTEMMLYSCPEAEGGCAVFGTADNRAVWLTPDGSHDRIRASGPGAFDFTENYVPSGGRITDVSGQYVIHTTATQQLVLRLGDSSGPKVTRAPGAAALDGDILWTAGGNAGEVTAYNLTTKKTVETLTTEAGCSPTELQALGRYLYWTCGDKAGVYDRTAKKSVSVPADEAKLGDGYVVTHDKAAGRLTLTTVADGTASSRVIGDLPDTGTSQRDVRWTVDEAGANAAYVDDKEQVHLVPSGVMQQPLRLLGPAVNSTWLNARYTDPTYYALTSLPLSKPANWRMTVRSRTTGKVVDTVDGSESRGDLRAGWDAVTASGLAPNGTYDWTLSATPVDGVGAPVAASGSFRLVDAAPVHRDHVGPDGNPDGVGDLLVLNSSGRLNFRTGTGKGTFSGQSSGSAWPTGIKAVPFGDLSGDRCNDVLVRYSSGALRLYKLDCGAYLEPSTPYTVLGISGWNQYDVLTAPGDVTKDGRPDLIARNSSTGAVYLYKGTSAGKLSARVKLYDNWKTYKKVVGVGDLNGDGVGDLVAQDKANNLYRYFGKGNGTFGARVKVFGAWGGSYNVIVGVGDITGDGRADLVSRDSAGVLWRNGGDGKGSFGGRVKIATGWQSYKGLF